MKRHKQGCMINISCCVDHGGAACPGPYGKCTCDGIPEEKVEELEFTLQINDLEKGNGTLITMENKEQQNWEIEFDSIIGYSLVRQKTKLYNDGQYSKGFKKDWESAEKEVQGMKDFIRKVEQSAYKQGQKDTMERLKNVKWDMLTKEGMLDLLEDLSKE